VIGRAAILIVALTACGGGAKLQGKTHTLDELIQTARAEGAVRCAPVELAMAESHNDFGKQELAEGNFYQARGELVIAEKNANAALRKTRAMPKEVCVPPTRVAKKRVDTDGDGLFDDEDDCPTKPEDFDKFEDEDGCPDVDNDKDTILDVDDACDNDPEDFDKFEDQDGCPEPDNDKDGLADKIDQCPDDPEDLDGFEDDDGCPDCDNDKDGVPECPQQVDKCPDQPAQTPDGCPQKYKLVVVTQTKIEIKQTIYFDFDKYSIKPVSFPLLNEVAQALKDNPTIKVRIEGHTDSQGTDKHNLKLSDGRARSVRTYLIKRGIDGGRVVSKGYGESMPIADNRSKEGRAENRRVEFVITER